MTTCNAKLLHALRSFPPAKSSTRNPKGLQGTWSSHDLASLAAERNATQGGCFFQSFFTYKLLYSLVKKHRRSEETTKEHGQGGCFFQIMGKGDASSRAWA